MVLPLLFTVDLLTIIVTGVSYMASLETRDDMISATFTYSSIYIYIVC